MRTEKISFCLVASLLTASIPFSARAEEPDAKRLALFPLQAVNVPEGTAKATALLLRGELVQKGYDVVPIADVEQAILDRQIEEEQTQPPSQAAPPASPAAPAAPGTAAEPGQEVQEPAVAVPQNPATPVSNAKAPPKMRRFDHTLKEKNAVARRLGVGQYLDATLLALGDRYRLEITWRATGGEALTTESMIAKTEDDLNTIIPRIVEALVTSKSVDETRTLDNASLAETDDLPNRFRLEKNFGPVVGMLVGFEEAGTGPVVGFNARLEANDFVADLIGMLGFPSFKDSHCDRVQGFILEAAIGAGGYLSHTQVAPYVLGGFGIWVGDRFGASETDKDSSDYEDYDEYDDDDDAIGGDLFAAFGIEFMRHTRIRLHLDVRYVFTFTGAGPTGHSVLPMIGLNF